MKQVSCLVALAVVVFWSCLVSGCASSESKASASHVPDGFVALFDGKTLDDWRPFVASPPDTQKMDAPEYAEALAAAYTRMKEHWKAEDGMIVTDGKGQNLCTKRAFKNFELFVDWKIEPGGDSGVYLRGCPQVQIWDRPDIGSGGLFNNQKNISKPLLIADHAPGEWNRFQITMIGDRVSVIFNDVLVVDNVPMENYWERDKSMYDSGPIELQAHGNTIRFRNIYVHELP